MDEPPLRVLPGTGPMTTLVVLAGVGWLTVCVAGLADLRLPWVVAALVAGAATLVAAVRGLPLAGVLALPLGTLAWGLATADRVPAEPTDVPGVLRLVGWNLAYALPLLVGLVTGLAADGRRAAASRIRAATAGRRWWGADRGRERAPLLAELETVRSAQFYVVPDEPLPHLVVAGRRVALVHEAAWPDGAYQLVHGAVTRDGEPYPQGDQDIAELAADVAVWADRLRGAATACRGYLVIPGSGRHHGGQPLTGRIAAEGVEVLTAGRFAEVARGYLAPEAYRVDIAVMRRIDEALGILPAGGPDRAGSTRPGTRTGSWRPADPPVSSGSTGGYRPGSQPGIG